MPSAPAEAAAASLCGSSAGPLSVAKVKRHSVLVCDTKGLAAL